MPDPLTSPTVQQLLAWLAQRPLEQPVVLYSVSCQPEGGQPQHLTGLYLEPAAAEAAGEAHLHTPQALEAVLRWPSIGRRVDGVRRGRAVITVWAHQLHLERP